jgi:hypothetical protein
MTTSRRWFLLVFGCVVAALAGCDNSQARLMNDLKVVGLDYINFHDANRKGPASWEELQKNSMDAQAVQRVKDAGYQVKWGVELNKIEGGTSNTVLAEKPGGRFKLMMDGSVTQ